MKDDTLIYHAKRNGYASYGRDGGKGRDIVLAPSQNVEADRSFASCILVPETTVAAILDDGPNAQMEKALQSLIPVWNNALRGNAFVLIDAPNLRTMCDEFLPRTLETFAKQKLSVEDIAPEALEEVRADVCGSAYIASGVMKSDEPVSFRMVYYPPSSKPLAIFHNWHADNYPPSLLGKVRIQRSVNHQGMRFAFKNQAEDDTVRGVALSPGRVALRSRPTTATVRPLYPAHRAV